MEEAIKRAEDKLGAASNLTALELTRDTLPRLTAPDVLRLVALPHLEHLSLRGCAVDSLAEFPSLSRLKKVSFAFLASLSRFLPLFTLSSPFFLFLPSL